VYKLRQTKRFKKDFDKLDKRRQKLILEKLALLTKKDWNPLDVKKLKGAKDSYRLRSGDYRILFDKRKTELVLVLVAVKHRKESYK
jgi:mRNA interferase RelE/StbE